MKKLIVAVLFLMALLVPAYAQQQSKAENLAHAIAKAEGFYVKGTCPNRFHNPGDITSSSTHSYPGQVGLSPHRHYVIFRNNQYGWAALLGQIQKIIDGTSKYYRQDMTFEQIARVYASDRLWGKNVCKILGVTMQTTFEDYFELAPKIKIEMEYFKMSGTPMNGWYAFDLDGTAAVYEGWQGVEHIGEPVQPVVDLMKKMMAEGKDVRWFTARAWPIGIEKPSSWTEQEFIGRLLSAKTAVQYINEWSSKNLGTVIPVTCVKDFGMISLMDDRLVQVIPNTGVRADGKPLEG